MPRRHVIAIAVLMCVPLPLFSLAATVVPLPQIVQRAAATFISIAVPVVDDDGPLIREKSTAVRRVEITYEPSEQVPAAIAERPTQVKSQTQVRPTRPSRTTKTAVQAEAGGGAPGTSGTASSPAETTDPPTTDGAPAEDQPGPGASVDPPVSTTPMPAGGSGSSGAPGGGNPGGSSGGGSSGGGSSGGGSSGGGSPGEGSSGDTSGGGSSGGDGSGGGSGAKPTEPPAHGRDDPGGGNGKAEAPSSDTGPEPAPQPEPPPSGGGPPDKGHGKP